MKNLFLILLLEFIFNFYALSQKNEINPDGYNKFYYPDKTLSSEGYMKDAKPVGYWKSYYPNSVLKTEGNRKGELLDSIWKFYDEKGFLTEIVDYKNGLRSGFNLKYKLISEDNIYKNILSSKELYVEGKLNGKSYYYNDSEKLEYTVEYEKGYKNGYEKHFDSIGTVILILRYSFNNLTDNEYINRKDKNGLKQGVWKEFYDNEKLKTFAVYLNDTLNGSYREYDTQGNIIKNLYYKKGNINISSADKHNENADNKEIRTVYYSNGKVKSVGTYINDVKVGKHIFYDSAGVEQNSIEYDVHGIMSAEGYTDSRGLKQNYWKYVYPDNSVKAEGKFVDDKPAGKWLFYFPNGKTEQIGNYKNGKPDGAWKWFYDNGNIRREGSFTDGLEQGFFFELSAKGDTIEAGKYVSGKKHGLWTLNVNDHTEKGEYYFGKRNGVWKYYYPDNILEFEGNFVEGVEEGLHKYYYPDKKLKVSGHYSGGTKTKKWKHYDTDGNLTDIIEYKAGEKYKINGEKITKN